MPSRYHLTPTAQKHVREAMHETRQRWGTNQAKKYRADFENGLQHLAENHPRLRTPHREALAEGTDFSLHLIEHRYVAYQPYGENDIIIAGIFHESMDMPRHLRDLQSMTRDEIDALRRDIKHLKTKAH